MEPRPRHTLFHVEPSSPLAQLAVQAAEHPALQPVDRARVHATQLTGDFGAQELQALQRYLQATSDSRTLRSIIQQSTAHVRIGRPGEDPAAAEKDAERRSKEREAWRAAMRNRASHRDYLDMVSDVRKEEVDAAKAESFSLYSQQMSLGGSLLVTLFSAALLGYFLGRAWFGASDPRCMVTSVVCGMAMLMVEGLLMVSRLSRVDMMNLDPAAKAKQQQQAVAEAASLKQLPGQLSAAAAANADDHHQLEHEHDGGGGDRATAVSSASAVVAPVSVSGASNAAAAGGYGSSSAVLRNRVTGQSHHPALAASAQAPSSASSTATSAGANSAAASGSIATTNAATGRSAADAALRRLQAAAASLSASDLGPRPAVGAVASSAGAASGTGTSDPEPGGATSSYTTKKDR